MPYKSNKGLPKSVKDTLPSGAQTIYRKAFNNALKQYKKNLMLKKEHIKLHGLQLKKNIRKKEKAGLKNESNQNQLRLFF